MSCRHVQHRLSGYIDGALGAHETWEVEKHLAACRTCARALGDLRRTVAAVQAAPRYEVTPDFADALQRRLASVNPKPARRAWLAALPNAFRPRVLPAWGLAAAATTLVILAYLPHTPPPTWQPPVAAPAFSSRELQSARAQSVALAATSPFEDVATTNLAASMPAGDGTTSE